MEIEYFKMPFKTKHFNTNQKAWIMEHSGSLSAKVKGRFRGNGRYVVAWVSWCAKYKPFPDIKKIDVDEKFYNMIMEIKC